MPVRMPKALFVLAIALPATAIAGHDLVRTIEFIGFTSDARHFLIKITDADTGDFLSLRSFETGKQVKAVPIESKKEQKKTIEDAKRRFKIVDKGTEGLAAPDGRHSLAGATQGGRFILNVLRGERTARLKEMKLETGKHGPAQASLKTAYWSKDGHRVVVIIHKRLEDEYGMDADEAYPLLFYPGELNFK